VSKTPIKGIIFDLGSTLIEFESRSWDEMTDEGQRLAYDHLIASDHSLPDYESFNDRLEEIKNQYRAAAAESLVEWCALDAWRKLLLQLGLENPEEQSRRSIDLFYNVVRDGVVLCEGALVTLQALKREGYKVGLISNTIFPRWSHEVDLDNFGLTPYIDFRIYSSEFGYRKPHLSIFEAGLEKIGLPANETIYVGDRYIEDVEGPMKAGMSAVLKYREGRDYPDPMPEGFDVIDKLSDLLKILDIEQ